MEHDPLIVKGNRLLFDRRKKEKEAGGDGAGAVRLDDLFQFLVPLIHYLVGLISCAYYLHDNFYVVVPILVALASLDVFFLFLVQQSWVREMATLSVTGLMGGTFLGVVLYSYYMVFYYGYRDLRVFTNVMGSQPVEQFVDAGMLGFAFSTSVDTSRAVGYKSFEEGGRMYCVAPIVDKQQGLSSPVKFWAVGENCCQPRGKFECGDAQNPKAHTGVVLLRPDMFAPATATWIVNEREGLLRQYERAVDLAQNVFGIPEFEPTPPFAASTVTTTTAAASTTGASSDVFVHWTMTPFSAQERFKASADWYAAFAILFGVVAFFMLAYLPKSDPPPADDDA